MNKLAKKFVTGIVIILAASFLCSIFLNTQFIERFYLHEKKQVIMEIRDEFVNLLQAGDSAMDAIQKIETDYKVVIVEIENPLVIDKKRKACMPLQ